MSRAIDRFLEAIGYPERASDGAASFTLQVDGGEMVVRETDGTLRLVCRLTDDAAQLPRLAEYAAGRMLREEAALAWGEGGVFLWQEAPASADAHALRRFFETFCDSCDWWRARLEDGRGEARPSEFPEMRILP